MKTYLSRIFFGFVLSEKLPIDENGEIIAPKDEVVVIEPRFDYDESSQFITIKESIIMCDERESWLVNINQIFEKYVNLIPWHNKIKKYCEKYQIPFQEPQWFMTIENW